MAELCAYCGKGPDEQTQVQRTDTEWLHMSCWGKDLKAKGYVPIKKPGLSAETTARVLTVTIALRAKVIELAGKECFDVPGCKEETRMGGANRPCMLCESDALILRAMREVSDEPRHKD